MTAGRAVVLRGDARRLPLPGGIADLICTSPPYFGLRSYTDDGEHYPGQIGSEATPGEWLAALLEATREWVRVLKPDGSLFVNLGDKYAGDGAPSRHGQGATGLQNFGPKTLRIGAGDKHIRRHADARPKSLLGLPWRYALACTDQLGLILRRDIIWDKPNGLPESVTDRCRSSHEYVFHLVKQPRYYAAVDEIREPHTGTSHPDNRARGGVSGNGVTHRQLGGGGPADFNPLGKLPGSVWTIPSAPLVIPARLGVDHFAAYPPELCRRIILGWSPPGICLECGEGRRPVVSAARIGAGKLWDASGRGVIDRLPRTHDEHTDRQHLGYACACTPYTDHPGTGNSGLHGPGGQRNILDGEGYPNTAMSLGHPGLSARPKVGPWRDYHLDQWTPPPTRPAIVVDPFAGTGTTMLAASVLGRTGIGIDRSGDYCRAAQWRIRDPGERSRVIGAPKPPPVADGQGELFDPLEAL